MENKPTVVESGHEDMIHDLKFDYYGLRMATASSDRTIRVFNVDPKTGETTLAPNGILVGHEGPVWELSWSHPKFGRCLLASCSHDRTVLIWEEDPSTHTWSIIYKYTAHALSVNSVAWAPYEYGLILACGSSDGTFSLLRLCDSGKWSTEIVTIDETSANRYGVTSVSWGPFVAAPAPTLRLALGCCDGSVRVFTAPASASPAAPSKWAQAVVGRHGDWVRSVAWAPSAAAAAEAGADAIAACAQDCSVAVWKAPKGAAPAAPAGPWEKTAVGEGKFPEGAWSVAWSECGTTLAVTAADGSVSLWKESFDNNGWNCIESLGETTN